ncbi:MAG: hypothetical protein WC045_00300 [Patescibacteria group bacterium]
MPTKHLTKALLCLVGTVAFATPAKGTNQPPEPQVTTAKLFFVTTNNPEVKRKTEKVFLGAYDDIVYSSVCADFRARKKMEIASFRIELIQMWLVESLNECTPPKKKVIAARASNGQLFLMQRKGNWEKEFFVMMPDICDQDSLKEYPAEIQAKARTFCHELDPLLTNKKAQEKTPPKETENKDDLLFAF